MARALTPHFHALYGVDLSPGMLAQAARTGLYENLHAGDMLEWLENRPAESAGLVLAADVVVYTGDLAPLFASVARVMDRRNGGLFAFTAQSHAGTGVALQTDMRFAHAPDYLHAVAEAAGLRMLSLEATSTRRDAGRDVPGLACVLGLADAPA